MLHSAGDEAESRPVIRSRRKAASLPPRVRGRVGTALGNQACFVRLCRIIEPSANGLPLLQIALNLGDAADIEQR